LQETRGYRQAFDRLRDLKPQIEQLQALLERPQQQMSGATEADGAPAEKLARLSGEQSAAAGGGRLPAHPGSTRQPPAQQASGGALACASAGDVAEAPAGNGCALLLKLSSA